MKHRSKLIAITGGRGAGKTWLARRLQRLLGPDASRLSLADFYLDRSNVPATLREKINLDHPRAIDWELFEGALRDCAMGRRIQVPQFSLATQTRCFDFKEISPGPVVLVDGLWLLCRRSVRTLFDFSVYLDCPAQLRLERQLAKNGAPSSEVDSFRRHFWKAITPMHERFVAPEGRWADIVMKQPSGDHEIDNLAEMIRALIAEDGPLLQKELVDARSFDLFSGTEWEATRSASTLSLHKAILANPS